MWCGGVGAFALRAVFFLQVGKHIVAENMLEHKMIRFHQILQVMETNMDLLASFGRCTVFRVISIRNMVALIRACPRSKGSRLSQKVCCVARDAVKHSASQVDRASVFCSMDFHRIELVLRLGMRLENELRSVLSAKLSSAFDHSSSNGDRLYKKSMRFCSSEIFKKVSHPAPAELGRTVCGYGQATDGLDKSGIVEPTRYRSCPVILQNVWTVSLERGADGLEG